ncbi:hypothetical protein [Streptomyces sp. FIT100]|uniref:hypothetical protein n=1 Tax=Streptomyces sp. FIT100 TaxID=2837956 RepID=UPI0037DA68DF
MLQTGRTTSDPTLSTVSTGPPRTAEHAELLIVDEADRLKPPHSNSSATTTTAPASD